MEMLNILKTDADPDFLGFVAHPLANMFPMIEGNAFEELKRDIAAQGILEPIRLYQGMILDGRNRYAAAKACEHKFTVDDFVQWEGTPAEAEAWVISTNLHRRQLTTKQKQDLITQMVRKNPGLSDREIARQLGVSNSTVGAARERLVHSPEVRKYEAFKSQWKKFSDAECSQFIRDHLADVKFLLAEVEKSNAQNPMT
jgi:ParB-like chromosome segregation protein Spo0J